VSRPSLDAATRTPSLHPTSSYASFLLSVYSSISNVFLVASFSSVDLHRAIHPIRADVAHCNNLAHRFKERNRRGNRSNISRGDDTGLVLGVDLEV
jgi:hypothetical protein